MTARRWLVTLTLLTWVGLVASGVRADDATLRARLEALGSLAGAELDLAHAAEAAIDRSVSDRALGDEAAATRAEHIAEASLGLIERRRARADSEARRDAARTERDGMRARLQAARSAAASDARERTRLAPEGSAP